VIVAVTTESSASPPRRRNAAMALPALSYGTNVAVPDGRHGLECPPQPQPHGGEGLTGEEVLDEGTVEDAAADAT
jgi:hypothetical protein